MSRILPLAVLLGITASAGAQAPTTPPAPPAPAGTNVVVNGDFAKFAPQDNLWDGVDGQGFLAGNRRGTYAVTESGSVGDLPMALSVAYTDMNGDKLPDLVTSDPAGILRVYFNSGTPTEPKFDHSEVIPLFPPQIAKDNKFDRGWWTGPHSVPKISMFDWGHRGAMDLTIGNYCGDILVVPNTGSSLAPAYAQPTNYDKVKIPIAGKRPWGNIFAPCVVDWNKDGKADLLIGEGSYSANAIHLLLNQSSSTTPKFSDDQRYYLCYGDGREQLVPTVADYNGDGLPDVLVGDRLGTIGVYLNQGSWKPGDELKLSENIKFGTTDKLGSGVAPYAVDVNGDGLFDLFIGKTNGRVALTINKGTKGQPKFDAPVELKGEKVFTDKTNIPGTWTMDAGNNRGNLYGYISVDDKEASPDGGKVLKCGFYPSPNKIFKMVPISVDGRDNSTDFFRYWREIWEPVPAQWAGYDRATDQYVIRQNLGALKVGGTYQLSFKVRGKGIESGACTLAYLGAAENVATKFKRLERGSVKADKNEAKDDVYVVENFISNGAWKTYEKTIQIAFKDKDVKKLDATTLAILEFKFTLPQYGANCDICDVKLVLK